MIPGASISLAHEGQTQKTTSGADGRYAFHSLAPGSYVVTANAKGFAPLTISVVSLAAGQTKELNLPLVIAVEQEQVTVEGENKGVSLESDRNAGAIILKGSDIDALSDDPNELQDELQALAGPAAGPNGGQIYIDGFEGGQIPPKSSILEVRVNQNPFSAEYDRIGYGRIEIITKPGSAKLKGQISSFGTDDAFNTANPLIKQQPNYYQYANFGNISGPISKTASYFFNAFRMSRQNSVVVDALNPSNLTSNLAEAYPTPSTYFSINPRIDFQLSKNNSISIRESFFRNTQSGMGVGTLSLPDQASSSIADTNEVQIGDTYVVNAHLLMEPRFMWRHIQNSQTPNLLTPTVTVQGAFTTGGASSGISQDHQDVFMLQNYMTATAGRQAMRFGVRLRAYHDVNKSTSHENGSYFFSSVAAYQAGTPSQYTATVINNAVARALLFDASLFLQDDWRVRPNFLMGIGLRYEGQNYIHDHADWAPRIAIAWSPGRIGKTPPKTVVRAGYGWFYNRFITPTAFNDSGATPYVIEAIHDNLINQRSYTIANPGFYDPTAAEPASVLTSAASSVPTYHSVDPHFRSSLDMQGGIGVDRQITKKVMANITYLYTQGVHQYLTDNVTAPLFDSASYTVVGPTPSAYNYQFQSGGFYRQNQIIVSSNVQLKHLTISGNYTFNNAKSDTQGVNSFPSVAQNPGFDYGRARFGITHKVFLLESYTAPHGIVFASLWAAQSGTPYNLTIGNDLTGNNQFDARPAFGTCGATDVVSTQYGCLDVNPTGKGETIVPYNLGTGPANYVTHVRVSKVFGVGPKLKTGG
jgi:hypothetical protein